MESFVLQLDTISRVETLKQQIVELVRRLWIWFEERIDCILQSFSQLPNLLVQIAVVDHYAIVVSLELLAQLNGERGNSCGGLRTLTVISNSSSLDSKYCIRLSNKATSSELGESLSTCSNLNFFISSFSFEIALFLLPALVFLLSILDCVVFLLNALVFRVIVDTVFEEGVGITGGSGAFRGGSSPSVLSGRGIV